MIPTRTRQPQSRHSHAPLPRRLLVLALLACAAAVMAPRPLQAADPLAPFVLADLNPASLRVGNPVSPPHYTEWISAYYFGNEG
jgi:hypothetical protein